MPKNTTRGRVVKSAPLEFCLLHLEFLSADAEFRDTLQRKAPELRREVAAARELPVGGPRSLGVAHEFVNYDEIVVTRVEGLSVAVDALADSEAARHATRGIVGTLDERHAEQLAARLADHVFRLSVVDDFHRIISKWIVELSGSAPCRTVYSIARGAY